MLQLFKKRAQQPVATTQTVVFMLDGMHCTSCSLLIDGELEDTPGVIKSETSYGHARTSITFDPEKISATQLEAVIVALGYQVTQAD